MQPDFQTCLDQLEKRRYQESLIRLPALLRQAQSPMEKVVAARVAGIAMLPGLERRLLRQAVSDPSCPPEGVMRLAGYYVAYGSFLLADELLEPHLHAGDWPVKDLAEAHGLMAVAMAARHRYRTAESHMAQAEVLMAQANLPDSTPLQYDKLSIPYFAGRWEEAEEGLLAMIERPDAGPNSYELLARCREHMGQSEGALEVIQAACERFPDDPVLWSIQGGLCWSLNRPDAALIALERHGALLPQRRHQRRIERLRKIVSGAATRLPVPMVRQGRNHCFPACIAMVKGYFGSPADQRAIGSLVMDGFSGTPLYRAIQHLEDEGWVCRTFKATSDRVKELIDRGVPPILGLEYSGGAHVQVCVGYDQEKRDLILQDPGHPYPGRLHERHFVEVYAHSDFWALTFAPADKAEALSFLPEEDDRMIRLAQRLWESLRGEDLTAAAEALDTLEGMAGGSTGMHLLRLRVWPRLGTREDCLDAANALLASYPGHLQIRTEVAQHLARLNLLKRAADLVREMVGSRPAHAWLILAEEASRAGEDPAVAASLCRKAALRDPLSSQPLVAWGQEEQRAGRLDRARALFEAAIEMDPQPAYAADLAGLLADEGKPAEAVVAFRQMLREQPRYAWAWWRRGEVHWQQGEMRKAMRCLRIAVAQAPEDAHYLQRLAQACEAISLFDRATALLAESPLLESHADLQSTLTIFHLDQGRHDAAIALAERARGNYPDDVRFPPLIAEALRRKGKVQEGRAVLAGATEAQPENPYLQARFGQYLLTEGEPEAGVAAMRRALAARTGDWPPVVEWSVSAAQAAGPSLPVLEFLQEEAASAPDLAWTVARLWLLLDPATAAQRAKEALTCQGETADTLTEYGRILMDAGQQADAARAFRCALDLQPDNARACYSMSLLAKADGTWLRKAALVEPDPEMARRYADLYGDFMENEKDWRGVEEFLAELKGKVPEAWRVTYIGYAHERQGRIEHAQECYDEANLRDPGLAWPYFRRAAVLMDQELPAEALSVINRALVRIPADVSLHWVKGKALEALNRGAEAVQAYHAALAHDSDWEPLRRSLFYLGVDDGWRRLADLSEPLPHRPRADLLAEWAEVLMENEKAGEAEMLLRVAEELDPTSIRVALALARASLLRGREQEAWDRTVDLLRQNPGAAAGWVGELREATAPTLAVAALGPALDGLQVTNRRIRAQLLNEQAEAYEALGQGQEAMRLSRSAWEDDPENLAVLRRLALAAAREGTPVEVVQLLDSVVERRRIPAAQPDLVNLFTQAALQLDKPRRPHWREQVRDRLWSLRRAGLLDTAEGLALRRSLTQMEVEFGRIQSASYAMAMGDLLLQWIAVGFYWLLSLVRHAPKEIRPGEVIAPVLVEYMTGFFYEASGGPAVYQHVVRRLNFVTFWVRLAPGTTTVILLSLLWLWNETGRLNVGPVLLGSLLVAGYLLPHFPRVEPRR